jgi:hypothetical protein
MSNASTSLSTAALAATLPVAVAAAASDPLVARLKSAEGDTRKTALDDAARQGAGAVEAIAALLGSSDTEEIRIAKRALARIVHHAGRPGAADEAKAVEKVLLLSLARLAPPQAKREVMWLLSEIAGDDAIPAIAELLRHPDLADDARMVLQRIPGKASLQALQNGYAAADPALRKAIGESLIKRGVTVPGFASDKLKPSKTTSVKAPQA